MDDLLWLLPVLACPLMMVAMMLVMGMGMRSGRKDDEAKGSSEGSVEELRAEQRRLAEQIERLESRDGRFEEREPTRAGA